jgi:ATP-dependent exoDNAse (exonuclease V) alpha subunit
MAQASPFMTGATALQTNSRVAREYLVALPAELQPEQRLDLVRGFSRELTDRYGFALDLTVHAPRDYPGSDPRNFHAHLLATTREVTAEGLGAKTSLELGDSRRQELGLPPAVHELLFVRERWAAATNAALREAHIEARVDHRSLAAQGIDREPYPHIPRAAFEMERHGYRSAQAERLRAEYQARVQRRMEREPERERFGSQAGAATAGGAMRDAPGGATRDAAGRAAGNAAANAASRLARDARPPTLEDIRRQAREDWLKLRREAGAQIGTRADAQRGVQAAAPRPGASHTRDDDDHLSR